MYSPRRYNYKPKSRQYYRKKKINKKFSPAAYKQNIPTFYQQKGRIIQTTPLRMYQVPTSLPNSQTLDRMFKTLQRAHYPGLSPSTFQYNGWYFTIFSSNTKDLFTFADESAAISSKINSDWLKAYIQELPSRPPIPQGYDIQAQILSLNLDFPSGMNYSQWHVDWTSPLVASPLQLIQKTVTTTTSAAFYNYTTSLFPSNDSNIFYTQLYFTSGGLNRRYQIQSTESTIDPSIQVYPLIDTSDDPEQVYLDCTRDLTQITINLLGNVSLFIAYRYIESF